ncbi:2-C-methyl-D-erythritol 4-phosphate cytidylyltransferase, chloroplastic-like isoform X1 [Cornus florida]|uniref:2-C-methyl-D-erythritol 4-phosphate cytidylyltransferase, chloroplastic-like isoform X1 n=2 Tax=Cornus florida TaxID=4283 RepID=UPI0028989B67|nr:2-C-methyl-D-erythritol 4-phosphate cytidylyltransferase, chloroplastic-like isoform X1 [Cornus florida]XP_059652081.1 2-C-methyl-D-erythritol 4-phosphate cytidylyltransferase, chloroplastic-like isoform X1 [Cornus florida]
MMTLQVSLSLSSYSSHFPVLFGTNLRIQSNSFTPILHFSNSNHLKNFGVVGKRRDRIDFVREARIASTSRISCSAEVGELKETDEIVKEKSVSVILLAGGKGKRMGASMPKQYLPLLGQPIALYRQACQSSIFYFLGN